MKFLIINKIEQRVNEYQQLNGTSKKWIAEKVGISPSRMYQIFKSEDMMLSVFIRFAIVLRCPIDDLFKVEITEEDN